jgi:alkanesulfonate monooxygenase SsuD/methylene tetrahydromethanopterin reductase-like flavin-dependent oxidoreductase (luciferase family)
VRFSIWADVDDWDETLSLVRHAEATGWDRAYVYDHFMGDGETADTAEPSPVLEATAVLAGLAAATTTIGLSVLVLGITYRHPAVLANWAAAVDRMSGGRLVLGLGAGWQLNEHEQYGIELGPPGVRVERFEEALHVIRGLLDQHETTFAGAHYRLERAIAEPKPVQYRLPILIGAKRDRIMNVVARHADEWNMWGLAPAVAERRAVLDRACERNGRDPATIQTSCQASWHVTATRAEADALLADRPGPNIAGPLDLLAERVAEWQEIGVHEVIVPAFTFGTGAERRDHLDAIVETIVPQFRS